MSDTIQAGSSGSLLFDTVRYVRANRFDAVIKFVTVKLFQNLGYLPGYECVRQLVGDNAKRGIFLLMGLLSTGLQGTCQGKPCPEWIQDSLKSKRLDVRYELNAWLKPGWMSEDLNGDGTPDIAVLVAERATHKKGILLLMSKAPDYFVFGAGTHFGDGSDDFGWAGKWYVYKKKTAYETRFDKKSGDIQGGKQIKLAHPCISIASGEDGAEVSGGLIYWTGKSYRWIHQGE